MFLVKVYLFNTAQKMKFPIKDFFSKCDQICSHLLKKFLMENSANGTLVYKNGYNQTPSTNLNKRLC